MKDLIERLEKVTGPDPKLDILLGLVADGRPLKEIKTWWFNVGNVEWVDGTFTIERPPRYTASVDAALTLLGADSEYEITTLYGIARVGINLNHGDDGSPFYGENKSGSVPIALCIAALKARMP